MSTAHLYLPESWTAAFAARIVRYRDLLILCIAVAICCASFVFAILFSSDQRYPVAAIQQGHALATRPIAAVVTPASKPVLAPNPTAEPIARNHRELVALERLGQRNYIEFSLPRSSSFEPVGPIELGIWRVDAHHDSVQASVLIGEHRVDVKHIGVDELVTIAIANGQKLELVVTRVSRNQVRGYISEPKDASWDLARTGHPQSPALR